MPPRKTPPSIIAAKTLAHALALTPLAILAWQFWDVYSTNSDALGADPVAEIEHRRSEEHTSELQSLMRISYAVFCLKKKNNHKNMNNHTCRTKPYVIT